MSETRLGTQHYCWGDDCPVCADDGGPAPTRHVTPPSTPSLPGEQPGGERRPLVRARYPLTPGQANVSLEDDDDFPALPGERADEEKP